MLDLFYKADLTSLITRGYRFEACAKCGMEPSKHVSFKNIQEFICQMDINIDNMTGRSKEVKSEPSSLKKDKSIPSSLTELCQQLRARIAQKSQLYSMSHEDQQALTAVLTSELGMIWQDLKTPPVDTTLSHEENAQLRRETFSEVLRVCEELVLHYLLLMDTFRSRGVFTDYANRSRLAAQLASDCTNLLNVRSIRCRIVSGIKAQRRVRSDDEGQQRGKSLNIAYKHDLHVKRGKTSTSRDKTLADDLKEIVENIGELDLQNVYDLLPCHVEAVTCKRDTKDGTPSIQEQEMDESPFQNRFRIKGCHSMPDLHRETLLEELEIAPLSRSLSLLVLLSAETNSSLEDHINPKEDLKRLLQDSDCEDDTSCETDLPPLLKAQSGYDSSRLQKLEQRLQRKMEEEKERRKQNALAEKPPHLRGAVVSVLVPPQTILHTAPARVSDRVLPETIKLSMHPPVYNVFTEEIDSASLDRMDQNLVEEEIGMKKVYEELRKSISTRYFSFDEDPRIEPTPTNAACCRNRNNNQNLFNPSLMRPNPYSISHRERMERASNRKRPVDVTTRSYRAWFNWWKCQLSLDDYLNYISTQDSDYLSVMFHLYDSEDEEEERRKLSQRQKKERRRKQQERINLLRKTKQEYVPGFWNVNTIRMGGLGKDAQLEEKYPDGEIQDVGESVCLGEPGESPTAELPDEEQVQARLERVWNALCLPEGQRLDMAIKYSSHEYRDHLQEAITAWEEAASLIQQRELLLSRLEDFEREASDPSRFFQQGYLGSSIARMEEANRREKLSSKISVVDNELSKIISHITTRFNDNITYKGRRYKEKMRWDRTEMLYWLQQERRVRSLERFAQTALPVRLPPLNHNQEFYSFNHEAMQDCIQQSHMREMSNTASYSNT